MRRAELFLCGRGRSLDPTRSPLGTRAPVPDDAIFASLSAGRGRFETAALFGAAGKLTKRDPIMFCQSLFGPTRRNAVHRTFDLQ
jgi:hypothetical protein